MKRVSRRSNHASPIEAALEEVSGAALVLDAALKIELATPAAEALLGFDVPVAVPGVDNSILDPRSTWADKEDYDRTAAKLVDLFVENFAEFADHVEEGVRQAGPKQPAAA